MIVYHESDFGGYFSQRVRFTPLTIRRCLPHNRCYILLISFPLGKEEDLPVTMETYGLHRYPGRLFIVEGVDGSGKSTQIALLRQWLISEGYTVFFSEWNSSPLVKKTTSRGKKKQLLTPTSFSLIHATDFADRTEHDIIPPLKAGAIVLADRYIYTAFARDVARKVDRQ